MTGWLVYLSLVFVATATPGPAVFFIMNKSGLYGWKKAVFSALGNITGLFVLGVIAVSGLGAILEASETLFTLVRYAGAAYLIYLGFVQIFCQPGLMPDEIDNNRSEEPGSRIFIQAFGVAVSNPKSIVFLTALFPQFISIDHALIPQFSALILTLMSFSFFFLMAYAILAHQAKNWLTRPSRRQWMNRASGSLFVGLGLLMAASSRR
ncbi:MAG: LysE family translocator [Desulfobacterales bacterium]|nr:LysE family translocator [Desulfobacterales bacterium]